MTAAGPDEFRASFFEECEELLEAMHDGFGKMLDDAADAETIHVIFRAVHSIKGGAGAFGLDALVAFAHHFETALDRVRSGKSESTDALLALFQHCGDHLSDLVAAARSDQPVDSEQAQLLGQQLDAVIGPVNGTRDEVSDAAETFVPMTLDLGAFGGPEPTPMAAARQGFTISFTADPELFSSGNEPALLFRALDRFGTTSIAADTADVPPLSALDASMSTMAWTIELETEVAEDVIRDVFDFVSDCASVSILPLVGPDVGPVLPNPGATVARSNVPDAFEAPDSFPASLADPIAEPRVGTPEDAPGATVGSGKPGASPSVTGPASPQTIRVDFERVDKLINLVGELVIKEAMLSQAVGMLDLPTGNDVLQELDGLKQLAGEIQEGVMAIRAQPVKPLFQRMARTIRDASSLTGKRVRLVMKGETTEVDKTVLERLVDPLNHMIRNAVDHGLEATEKRRQAGKNPEGTVTLSAAHRSGRVIIEVSDDGGGINREKVRKLAEDKGLVAPGAILNAAEIDALLFMPGFSSKDEVSELSGRGVGLDVVRSEINALGGRMSISSELGKGTVFSISLPLTLAVLEGMVVEVAGQTMVVPITAIQETLQPSTAQIHTIGCGSRVLSIREGLVPLADLGAIFGFRETPVDLTDHVLLVIETETERRCALIVDGLQDQRQVVIKSLETNYTQVDGIAAATILGDGRIALIVDPEGIVGGIAPVPVSLGRPPHTDPVEGENLVTA